MAAIIPFPLHRRLAQDFDRIFKVPGLGTVSMTPMDLGGHFVTVEPEVAHRNLVTALAEFRAKQEQDRRTAEQMRWYARKDKPTGPEAA